MRFILIIICVLLTIPDYTLSSEEYPETSSAQFLKISPSPRANSLGNAYCSIIGDADSLFYNPSTISFIKRINFSLSYIKWFQSYNYIGLFGVYPLKEKGSIGAGLFSISGDDILKTTDDGQGNITLTDERIFSGDYCFVGSYAYNIQKYLSAGINLKFIYQKIEIEKSFGIAFDFGVLFKPEKDMWTVGCSIQNLGTKSKFVEDKFNLPATFRLGGNYHFILTKGNKLLTMAEIQKTIYEGLSFGMGVEYGYNKMFFARAGYEYQNKSDSIGIKAGCGINIENIKINYGFDLFNNLGTVHFIQLNITFGHIKSQIVKAKKEDKILIIDALRYLSLANHYMRNKEYNKALPEYLKVISANPYHIKVAYNIACIYSIQNDTDTAIEWLKYVLSLDGTIIEKIKKDPDFKNIKNTEFYKNILNKKAKQ